MQNSNAELMVPVNELEETENKLDRVNVVLNLLLNHVMDRDATEIRYNEMEVAYDTIEAVQGMIGDIRDYLSATVDAVYNAAKEAKSK